MTDFKPGTGQPDRADWLRLSALAVAFALSNAYRTLPAILAADIQREFSISSQQIALFAGTFHLAFGAMQIFMGVALDRFVPERTSGSMFLVAASGAALSYFAPNFAFLIAGQVLIGIGCSSAFLGTLVFVTQRFPAERFAAMSGALLGIGGLGMLLTGTPLAFVVETWSWRGGFAVLAVTSVISGIACIVLSRSEMPRHDGPRETVRQSFRQVGAILILPQTAGVLVFGAVAYATQLAVRGLWIVPFFSERHAFALIESGHVVLWLSILMLASPPLFGRIDPGGMARRYLMVGCGIITAATMLGLGFGRVNSTVTDILIITIMGIVSGFVVLQYSDVRSAYPPQIIARAFSVLNTAIFLGVAIVQGLTGIVASVALSMNGGPLQWVFVGLAILLTLSCAGFMLLPAPPSLLPVRKDPS